MKKTRVLALLAASALAFTLFSCSGSTGGDSGSTTNNNTKDNHEKEDQPIKGTLTESDTWEGKDASGNPITYYINSEYGITKGGTLTITEGAIVKLGPSGTIQVKEGGSLIATDVVFTSYRDSRGRKILAAGDAEPKPGDWKNVYVGGGHAVLTDCEFSYGGNGANTVSVIKVGKSNATCRVDGCLFKNNSGSKEVDNDIHAALRYEDNVEYNEDNYVTNTTFENNVWPLTIPAYFSVSDTLTFGAGDKANEYNMIHINSNTIKNQTVTWTYQTVPYIHPSSSNKIILESGGILNILGGPDRDHPTVIEFDHNGLHINKGGQLKLASNILFTNSEKSSNNKFEGIYASTDFWVSSRVNETGQKNIVKVHYISNTSENIIIENDQPSSNDFINDTYHEDRTVIIQKENPVVTLLDDYGKV